MSAAGNPIAHMTSSRAVTLFSDIPLILIPSAFVPLFKLSWIPGLLFHLLLLISPAATLFRFDERTIYCLSFCIKDSSGYIHEETLYGEEFDILNNFVSAVSKFDPDIITGYNIDGYDLPLLVERADVHRIDLNFGRNKSKIENKMQTHKRLNEQTDQTK